MSPFPSPLAFSPLHLGKAPESKRQLLPNSKFVQPQQSAWKIAESSRKPCSGLPAQRLLSCLSLTPQPPSGLWEPTPALGSRGGACRAARAACSPQSPRTPGQGSSQCQGGEMHPSASSPMSLPSLLPFPAMQGKELLSPPSCSVQRAGAEEKAAEKPGGAALVSLHPPAPALLGRAFPRTKQTLSCACMGTHSDHGGCSTITARQEWATSFREFLLGLGTGIAPHHLPQPRDHKGLTFRAEGERTQRHQHSVKL